MRNIKVVVEVSGYEANRIKEEFEFVSHKKISIKEVTKRFVNNLMDRYFSTEYLDIECLEE
jgi:ribosomal protein S10